MLLSEPYWLPGMRIPFGPCIRPAPTHVPSSQSPAKSFTRHTILSHRNSHRLGFIPGVSDRMPAGLCSCSKACPVVFRLCSSGLAMSGAGHQSRTPVFDWLDRTGPGRAITELNQFARTGIQVGVAAVKEQGRNQDRRAGRHDQCDFLRMKLVTHIRTRVRVKRQV